MKGKYIEQYKALHKQKRYGISGDSLVENLFSVADRQTTSVLDYGCGQSDTGTKLAAMLGTKVLCQYDPAVEGRDSPIKGKYYLCICTDVLEHIPEEELDKVFKDITKHTDKEVIFVIALREAAQILPNGENAHCTVKPKEWWEDKLKTAFPGVNYIRIYSKPYYTAWFKCSV